MAARVGVPKLYVSHRFVSGLPYYYQVDRAEGREQRPLSEILGEGLEKGEGKYIQTNKSISPS